MHCGEWRDRTRNRSASEAEEKQERGDVVSGCVSQGTIRHDTSGRDVSMVSQICRQAHKGKLACGGAYLGSRVLQEVGARAPARHQAAYDCRTAGRVE